MFDEKYNGLRIVVTDAAMRELFKHEKTMKCQKCNKQMSYQKGMQFNGYEIDGWKCQCGEIYYEPQQAHKILLLNKLRKEAIRAKLGRIKSNLIIRVPKEIETALNLKTGEAVFIKVEKGKMEISV